MNKFTEKSGFTLIETLMAMAIFSIGILALYAMQAAAIKENISANKITTASNWAQDRVEKLLAKEYADPQLLDVDDDGCAGLGDWPAGADFVDTTDPGYTIYWNVADNCTLTDILAAAKAEEEQKPKHFRVIVTQTVAGIEEEYAVFNYIKQNTI